MRVIPINSENAEFQIIQSLKLNRIKRNKLNEIFVEGTECIKQLVSAGWKITRIITANNGKLSSWAENIINTNQYARIIEMKAELYNQLCDRSNPSELLVTAEKNAPKHKAAGVQNPFILTFDRPGDFGNLGSIIRSANAFGVDAVYIIGHGVDVYEPKVIRASLGSVFFTEIKTIDSMEELEKIIKTEKTKNGLKVIGTDSQGAVSIGEKEYKRPIMVIIGNESKGMSIKLQNICDEIVKIPISGNVNSLNVSCAASIIMWEIDKHTKTTFH
jgi:TrmH family RNA methyltransferase